MKFSPRKKLLILAAYLFALLLILTAYHKRRIDAIYKTKSTISRVQGEIAAINKKLAEIDRYKTSFSSRPQIMAYVEALYRIADENRLNFHEVVTENAQNSAGNAALIASTRLKITVKGDFRSVVEYVRSISNQQQFSRIVDLKIAADQKNLLGNITIELFSFK